MQTILGRSYAYGLLISRLSTNESLQLPGNGLNEQIFITFVD